MSYDFSESKLEAFLKKEGRYDEYLDTWNKRFKEHRVSLEKHWKDVKKAFRTIVKNNKLPIELEIKMNPTSGSFNERDSHICICTNSSLNGFNFLKLLMRYEVDSDELTLYSPDRITFDENECKNHIWCNKENTKWDIESLYNDDGTINTQAIEYSLKTTLMDAKKLAMDVLKRINEGLYEDEF